MKRFLKIILWCLAIVTFLNVLKSLFLGNYPDFTIYYNAVKEIARNGNPYMPHGGYPAGYLYPPVCLLFLYPLQFFSYNTAGIIWTILSITALLASLYLLIKISNEKFTSNKALLIYSLVFLLFPVRWTLGAGQINNFILLLLCFALYFLLNKKENLVGILLGLTLSIKYYPVFIIPYLIFRKKWRILFYLSLTVITLTAAGFIFINFRTNIFFFTDTFPMLIFSNGLDYYYNQALSGFVQRLTDDNTARWLWRAVIASVILLTTSFVFFKRKKPDNRQILLELATVITVSVLLNSFSWQYHYTWLIIPFILFLPDMWNNTKIKTKQVLTLCISYILIAINLRYPSAFPVIVQSHTFYGGLLLWILEMLLLSRKFQKSPKFKS